MLPCSPATASEAFGYMLERPRIPRYSSTQVGSENVPGADNQQERPESRKRSGNPQRLHAERLTFLNRRLR
jgi:hypothetical protein